ncbi:DUF3631 domain-containing protein [Burkholderiaceae bacterium FT117]|uniref:DUF3631 domain-containing protein n=1 Tax=Zeimonas sediminis TaxID=2944268 RepID=UPI0023430427|nr:DUF3631 domain-containing protein [Zeimonas sediminis]MCM5570055.1 DUF3631 domain-containing protein [Zeimonas sediminis]
MMNNKRHPAGSAAQEPESPDRLNSLADQPEARKSAGAPKFAWLPARFLMKGPVASRDYLTIVSTRMPCGKHVHLDDEGAAVWESRGDVIEGDTVTAYVPDVSAMGQLLEILPANRYLIPDFVPGTEGLSTPFRIHSQKNLSRLLSERGIEHNATRPAGLFKVPRRGGTGEVVHVAKLKENFTPGAWRLFDFDRDEHTPADIAALAPEEAVRRLEQALPGLAGCARVIVPSSKGRVCRADGSPLSASPNFHMWVQVGDPEQTDEFRERLRPQLFREGLGWRKPKFARNAPGKPIGSAPAAIVDASVWAISRSVYAGAPAVGDGLVLAPAEPVVTAGHRFVLGALPAPDDKALRVYEEGAGVKVERDDAGKLVQRDYVSLVPDTLLDVKTPGGAFRALTLREFLDSPEFEAGMKYRCQAPFRDSTSENGILRKHDNGRATVHDNGTGITYFYSPPGGLAALTAVLGREPAELMTARIDELAQLATLAYERCRKDEAKQLGLRVTMLDAAVQEARKRLGLVEHEGADGAQGRALRFEDPELWPESVDGAVLLDEITSIFSRYVSLPRHGDVVLALWVLFTYVIDSATHAPLLVLTSPVKRCGKSRTFDVLARLVRRPLPTSNVTVAALFRVIEQHMPTVLLDELDALLEGDKTGELRGLVNAGHSRTAAYVLRTVGDEHETRAFNVWSPKALALIGDLARKWSTVADRAVAIRMQRKPANCRLPRLPRDDAAFGDLRRRIARWADDQADWLRDAEPPLPDSLNDRAADNWHILVAIADAAGGHWPAAARAAALALSAQESSVNATDEGAGVRLLADIRDIFMRLGIDRIRSESLTHELAEIDDPEAPWSDWNSRTRVVAHGIDARQVARQLAPFGIRPRSIRLVPGAAEREGLRRFGIKPSGTGAESAKGYLREQFNDAFERYLSPHNTASQPESADSSGTPAQSSIHEAFGPIDPSVTAACVTGAESPGNPRQSSFVPVLRTETQGAAREKERHGYCLICGEPGASGLCNDCRHRDGVEGGHEGATT